MTLQTQAKRVLGKFSDDLNQVASMTGHPYKRLWNWRDRGIIPQEYHQGLLDSAVEHRRDLHPFDFVAHLHRPVVAPETETPNRPNGVTHDGQ